MNSRKPTRNRGRAKRARSPPVSQERMYRELERNSVPSAYLSNSPFPSSKRARLTFYEPNLAIVPGAVASFVKDWRMNSVYDPDPAIGGGTVSGFSQLIAIWNLWRVDRFRFRYEVVNQETANPLQFGFTMKDWQPSTVLTTYALCQDALEVAPSTGPHSLGVLSGNSVYRSGGRGSGDSRWLPWINVSSILGEPLLYRASAGYSGQGSANPASVIWISLILLCDGAAGTIPNGIILNLEMQFDTMFWSTVSSLPSFQERSLSNKMELEAKDAKKKVSHVSVTTGRSDLRVSQDSNGTFVLVPRDLPGHFRDHPFH